MSRKRNANGAVRPTIQRARDKRAAARAEQRIHVMGLACAFHSREALVTTRNRISAALAEATAW